MNIFIKIFYLPVRLFYFLVDLHVRMLRVLNHLTSIFFLFFKKNEIKGYDDERRWRMRLLYWFVELVFYLLDILAFPDLYEYLIDVFKGSSRQLTKKEQEIAQSVFKDSINLSRVRIDDRSVVGSKKHQYAYVSFYTINLYGKMSPGLLIHELTHIWQYVNYGSVYIPRALWAQKSPQAYDYGSSEAIQLSTTLGNGLDFFNYEQQAEIISDFYRIRSGLKPHWGDAKMDQIHIYTGFINSFLGIKPVIDIPGEQI